MMIMMIQFRW